MLTSTQDIEAFFEGHPLLSGSIRVTNRCNLSCQHCYAFQNHGTGELSTDEITSAIDAFSHLGAFRMFLTGGEPFIRDDMLSIIKRKGSKISLYISTNGTLLTSEIIKELSQTEIGSLQFSIDGMEKTHDMLRGQPGAFRCTVAAVREAVPKVRNVGVSTVLTRYNSDEVFDLLNLAESMRCKFFQLTFLHFSGKATKEQDVSLKKKVEIVDHLRMMSESLKLDVSVAAPPPFAVTEESAYLCTFPYILGVNANGDIAPCDGLLHVNDMIVGNLREKSIEDIWEQSGLLQKIRDMHPEQWKGICSRCTVRDSCAGGCRAASFLLYGDFTSPDPLCQEAYNKGIFPSRYIGGE